MNARLTGEFRNPAHRPNGSRLVRVRTGRADLPLHAGRAPRWLFEKITALAPEMLLAILCQENPDGLLRRQPSGLEQPPGKDRPNAP